MDTYVSISEKRHDQILRSGPSKPRTHPCPGMCSLKALSKHHSKAQHRTLRQAKPTFQNPYTSFTLRGAQRG